MTSDTLHFPTVRSYHPLFIRLREQIYCITRQPEPLSKGPYSLSGRAILSHSVHIICEIDPTNALRPTCVFPKSYATLGSHFQVSFKTLAFILPIL